MVLAAGRTNVSPTLTHLLKVVEKPKVVIKDLEPWEIEAEQVLLTEGERRRARADAAIAQAQPTSSLSPPPPTSPVPTQDPSNSQYFSHNTQTLRWLASSPPTKSAGHALAGCSFRIQSDVLSIGQSFCSNTYITTVAHHRATVCQHIAGSHTRKSTHGFKLCSTKWLY